MEKRPVCTACGQKVPVEHTHSLNTGIVGALIMFYEAAGREPYRLSEFLERGRMTRNQADNFQKLKYWGLVEPHVTEENRRKRGWWRVTQLAVDFIENGRKLQSSMVTFQDVPVRGRGQEIGISDVVEGYKYRADYADDARVPEAAGQGTLI